MFSSFFFFLTNWLILCLLYFSQTRPYRADSLRIFIFILLWKLKNCVLNVSFFFFSQRCAKKDELQKQKSMSNDFTLKDKFMNYVFLYNFKVFFVTPVISELQWGSSFDTIYLPEGRFFCSRNFFTWSIFMKILPYFFLRDSFIIKAANICNHPSSF